MPKGYGIAKRPKKAKSEQNRPALKRGRQVRVFNTALNELNAEIMKTSDPSKKKSRKYFTKDDARYAFDATKGRCSYCLTKLVVQGDINHNAKFMLHIPLPIGKVSRDNLLAVCYRCKIGNSKVKRNMPLERVYDFNTIPDLIQRLMEETLKKKDCDADKVRFHEEVIQRLKNEINSCITEFVQIGAYFPRTEARDHVPKMRYDGDNTFGDETTALGEAIVEGDEEKQEAAKESQAETLKEINLLKSKYRIIKT